MEPTTHRGSGMLLEPVGTETRLIGNPATDCRLPRSAVFEFAIAEQAFLPPGDERIG